MFTALYVKFVALQHGLSFMKCLGHGITSKDFNYLGVRMNYGLRPLHHNFIFYFVITDKDVDLFYACSDVAYYLLWFSNMSVFHLIERK